MGSWEWLWLTYPSFTTWAMMDGIPAETWTFGRHYPLPLRSRG